MAGQDVNAITAPAVTQLVFTKPIFRTEATEPGCKRLLAEGAFLPRGVRDHGEMDVRRPREGTPYYLSWRCGRAPWAASLLLMGRSRGCQASAPHIVIAAA